MARYCVIIGVAGSAAGTSEFVSGKTRIAVSFMGSGSAGIATLARRPIIRKWHKTFGEIEEMATAKQSKSRKSAASRAKAPAKAAAKAPARAKSKPPVKRGAAAKSSAAKSK